MKMEKIATLVNGYDLYFPIENEVSILIGENGSGKTLSLEALVSYYEEKGENVLYFPEDRGINLPVQRMIQLMEEEMEKETNIYKKFHISLNAHDFSSYDPTIVTAGKVQIINFITTIQNELLPSIVIIDFPEKNVDIESQRHIVKTLYEMDNVQQIIVTTHSPCILGDISEHALEMGQLLR